MSRIGNLASYRKESAKPALAAFVTAGHPSLDATVPALNALVEGGVDLLEIGVPFSDPEAEGPVIQRSSETALSNGVSLLDSLQYVTEFREQNQTTPVVLMGYLNCFLAMGYQDFAVSASRAGVDGVIIVNLPPENATEMRSALRSQGIDLILLVAPTTNRERCRYITSQSRGFVYFVSLKGITGADSFSLEHIQDKVLLVKGMTELPVFIGFGIKTPDAARRAAQVADGVVVGSAFVETMESASSLNELTRAIRTQAMSIRMALDEA